MGIDKQDFDHQLDGLVVGEEVHLLVVERGEDGADVVEFDGKLGKRGLSIGGVVVWVGVFPLAKHYDHHDMAVPLELIVAVSGG